MGAESKILSGSCSSSRQSVLLGSTRYYHMAIVLIIFIHSSDDEELISPRTAGRFTESALWGLWRQTPMVVFTASTAGELDTIKWKYQSKEWYDLDWDLPKSKATLSKCFWVRKWSAIGCLYPLFLPQSVCSGGRYPE